MEELSILLTIFVSVGIDDNNGGYYIELNNEIIADKHMTIDYNE